MSGLQNILPGSIICPDLGQNTIARDCCPAVFIAPQTGGTVADYELTRVLTTGQVDGFFGAGSPAADMAKLYLEVNPYGEAYVLPYTAAGAAATGQIALAGIATENGNLQFAVNGEVVTVTGIIGDTAADLAGFAVAEITGGPVTAVAAGDNVNLTATFQGAEGNQIQVVLLDEVPGITATVAPMAGGAGLPDYAAILAALGDCCCYGFIAHLLTDDVSMSTFADEMRKRWGCECFTGGRTYTAFRGTFSEIYGHAVARQGLDPFASTVAVCPGEFQADYQKLAAYVARAHAISCDDPAKAWAGDAAELFGIDNVATQRCGESCFTRTERNLLALAGISTTINGAFGFQVIEADVGRGRINVNGETDLYMSYPQSAYQTVRFAQLFSEWAKGFEGLNISATEVGGRRGVAVLTPNMFKSEYKAFLRDYEGTLIENVDAAIDLVTFEIDERNPSGACVQVYFDPISAFRTFSVTLSPRINLQEIAQ